MKKSEKLIYCWTCGDITAHEVLRNYRARCIKCGSVKSLSNPHIVEAEIATQGDPRKA